MGLQILSEEFTSLSSLFHSQRCQGRVVPIRVLNVQMLSMVGPLSVPHEEQVVVIVMIVVSGAC
jgi:hypothetical protein